MEEMQKRWGLYCIPPERLRDEGIKLENIISYHSKRQVKVDPSQPLCLSNSVGVPATFYFCLTLEAEMVKSICSLAPEAYQHECPEFAKGVKGAPAPGSVRSLLDWAKRHNGIEPKRSVHWRLELCACELRKALLAVPQGAPNSLATGTGGGRLDDFLKKVVHIFTEQYTEKVHPKTRAAPISASLPRSCKLLREVTLEGSQYPQGTWERSVDIFDFSGKRRMRRAAEVVRCVDGNTLAPHSRLLVLPVGDALQEPFWPEGLGVNRGLHNALDGAWVATKWAAARGSDELERLVLSEREALYKLTKQMSGRLRNMLKGYNRATGAPMSGSNAHTQYSADPKSRYHDADFDDSLSVEWAHNARAAAPPVLTSRGTGSSSFR